MISRKVFYSGRVQGVGFRWNARHIASEFEVSGRIRNLPDGRVELAVCGEEEEVGEFLRAIRESGLAAHIQTEVSESWEPELPPKGFIIVA